LINIYGISTLPSATTAPLKGSQNRLLKYLNQQTLIPATINIAAIRLSQGSTAHNSLLNATPAFQNNVLLKATLLDSEWLLIEHQNDGPDLVPTPSVVLLSSRATDASLSSVGISTPTFDMSPNTHVQNAIPSTDNCVISGNIPVTAMLKS
jgi:hypothetical protein